MGQSQSSRDEHISEDLIGNDDDDAGAIETVSKGRNAPRFLVEHPLERSGRRLLSKSDVLTSFQAAGNDVRHHHHNDTEEEEEKRSKTILSYRHGMEGERMQNKYEVLSNAATDATRKMSNVDLSSPKRKFRERAQAKRMHQQQASSNEDARYVTECDQTKHTGGIQSEPNSSKLHGRHIVLTNSKFFEGRRQVKATCLSPTFACFSGSYGVVGTSRRTGWESTPYSKVLELSFESFILGKYEQEWRFVKGRDKSPSAQLGLNAMLVDTTKTRQIVYSANGNSFLGLALTGSLRLANLGVSSSHYEKEYLILRDSSTEGVPLAVCALKSPREPVVRIYATKPCIGGQVPAASSSDIGVVGPSVDLYAFAEFRAEGSFPYPMRYSIFFSTGEEGKYEKDPKYKGSHPVPGSPNVTFVGRLGRDPVFKGCCLLTTEDSKEYIDQSNCQITVSKGIDPALFVCIAAIIDEVAMWRQPSEENRGRRLYV